MSMPPATNHFQSMVISALDEVAPKKKIVKGKTFMWWNNDLHPLRMEYRLLLHKAKCSGDPEDWDVNRLKIKEYNYYTMKAKREAWKEFTSKSDKMVY